MNMLRLGLASLWSRRGSALLTVLSIAVSVALLLGVEATRAAARASFASTVSGVDLVVGARGGSLNLLLYSVFRIGDATANVSWDSYQKIARHRDVAWTIPLQLGDSHRGYRVLGTSAGYFTHYRYANDRPLALAAGAPFAAPYDVVLGADVARRLAYRLDQRIAIAHGLADADFARHDEHDFRIVGILAPTGTPVDRTIHVSLETLGALHHESAPTSLTAFMVGMQSRAMTFTMQRAINTYRQEALQAVLPGVVLTQLWEMVGAADRALYAVAAGVALAGMLGLLGATLAGLRERRREMAILRSVGASPRHLVALLASETLLLCLVGIAIGVALAWLLTLAAGPLLQSHLGILPVPAWPAREALLFLAVLLLLAAGTGALAGWRAARGTLAQGLTPRD